jgi:outer membrane murein-binding lipoprotein Lpp
MSIFKRKARVENGKGAVKASGVVKVEDLDQLLTLAGIEGGSFDNIVKKAGSKVQTMRIKAANLKSEATGVLEAAQEAYNEETRAARAKLDKVNDHFSTTMIESLELTRVANEAEGLLVKYSKPD